LQGWFFFLHQKHTHYLPSPASPKCVYVSLGRILTRGFGEMDEPAIFPKLNPGLILVRNGNI